MQNLYSPRIVRNILTENNLYAKKKFGQNFLVDRNIAEKIADSADINGCTVVEIGPGIGSLTRELAVRAKKVIALEIDNEIIPVLKENVSDLGNVEIIQGDAVKEDFDKLIEGIMGSNELNKGYYIVANLPYYITTPIIMHLFENKYNIKSIVIMIQKEVAERIAADPGNKSYGSLSVAVQFFAEPKFIMKVSPNVFFPKPEVESAVLKLDKNIKCPVKISDKEFFFAVFRAAFSKRRKTIVNALSNSPLKLDKAAIIKACQIISLSPKVRAEELTIAQFAQLSEAIINLQDHA
jgi:16S rRNA (adenine1518-N6/adenine1519-N6)-dimethyltransferase